MDKLLAAAKKGERQVNNVDLEDDGEGQENNNKQKQVVIGKV